MAKARKENWSRWKIYESDYKISLFVFPQEKLKRNERPNRASERRNNVRILSHDKVFSKWQWFHRVFVYFMHMWTFLTKKFLDFFVSFIFSVRSIFHGYDFLRFILYTVKHDQSNPIREMMMMTIHASDVVLRIWILFLRPCYSIVLKQY